MGDHRSRAAEAQHQEDHQPGPEGDDQAPPNRRARAGAPGVFALRRASFRLVRAMLRAMRSIIAGIVTRASSANGRGAGIMGAILC